MTDRRDKPVLADIAKKVGVSAMTVSKALNGRDGVADETRTRILKVADEIGYVPNFAARGLAKRRSNLIGLVTHDLTVQYAIELLRGVADELADSGQELLVSATYLDPSRESMRIQQLARGMVDAIILVAPVFGDDTKRAISDIEVPVVVLDPRRIDEVAQVCPSVYVDNYQGTRQATEHLLALGHHRIGFAGGDLLFDSAEERRRGFADAVVLGGAATDEALAVEAGFSQRAGFEAGEFLLSLDRPPTGIVAACDVAALGVMDAARARGLSVPGDLSVVGFDDIPMAEHLVPALTTVRQPLHHMGRTAAWIASILSQGEQPPLSAHRFDTELVVRETTGPPRQNEQQMPHSGQSSKCA